MSQEQAFLIGGGQIHRITGARGETPPCPEARFKRGDTKARVWEGVTEGGVRFTAYIPIVQVHKGEDNSQFERELSEHKQPDDRTSRAIDARMIL